MDTLVIGLLSAIPAAVVAWLIAIRRTSGDIAKSTAEELWDESRSIRDEYRTRNAALEKENALCQQRIHELEEGRMKDRERIAVLEAEIARLRGDDEPPAHLA
jgi:hypothetical protein